MRLILSILVVYSCVSNAKFSTFDTADILRKDEMRLGAETQIVFSRDPGVNVIGHFDVPTSADSELKFLMGTGKTSFQVGSFFKFVPFPDFERQPGIGGMFGVIVTSQDGKAGIHFRLHPLVSKRFETENIGTFTPYTSIPFGISAEKGTTYYPVNFVLGTTWLPQNMKHLNVVGEMGVELQSSFTYFSLGVSLPFDTTEGLSFD